MISSNLLYGYKRKIGDTRQSIHAITGDPTVPHGSLLKTAKIYNITLKDENSKVISKCRQIFFIGDNTLYSEHSFGLNLKKIGSFYKGNKKVYNVSGNDLEENRFYPENTKIAINFVKEIEVWNDDYKKLVDLGIKINKLKSERTIAELNAVIKKIYDQSGLGNSE